MVSTDGRTDGQTDGRTDGRTDRRTDTEGYNIIPRHTLVAGYKNPLSCLICVHLGWGKNHQMTQITSRNHTAWGPTRRVGLLVNTAYPMQSVKTRMR